MSFCMCCSNATVFYILLDNRKCECMNRKKHILERNHPKMALIILKDLFDRVCKGIIIYTFQRNIELGTFGYSLLWFIDYFDMPLYFSSIVYLKYYSTQHSSQMYFKCPFIYIPLHITVVFAPCLLMGI